MTIQVQQHFDDTNVALVDAYVQRGLAPLVSGVEVCAASVQQLNHCWLVAERGVVHSTVAVFILWVK